MLKKGAENKEDVIGANNAGPDMRAGLYLEQVDVIQTFGPKSTADQLRKDAADINRLEIVASPLRKGFVLMAPDNLFA